MPLRMSLECSLNINQGILVLLSAPINERVVLAQERIGYCLLTKKLNQAHEVLSCAEHLPLSKHAAS